MLFAIFFAHGTLAKNFLDCSCMKLLIDGYNLFKQIDDVTLLSPAQRSKYVNMLERYVQMKALQGLLVFDGGLQERASYEGESLLEIVYVGKNRTADDFIKDFLQESHGKDILLVSSDRELNKVADYYQVASIDVLDFWYFVKDALVDKKKSVKKTGHIIKVSGSDHPELDALMKTLKVTSIKSDDLIIDKGATSRLKRSKIDKKLLQKVKKL
ncbi:MAG TPA: NYN domain-containing protein [Patescibacteria group bacterium]|jgi:hypothetical protein|nr:NYN domain-containing protein [Patescibacteria group bacterium]